MVVATHEGRMWALAQGLQGEIPVRAVGKPKLTPQYPVVRLDRFDPNDGEWVVIAEVVPGSIKFFKAGERDGRSL